MSNASSPGSWALPPRHLRTPCVWPRHTLAPLVAWWFFPFSIYPLTLMLWPYCFMMIITLGHCRHRHPHPHWSRYYFEILGLEPRVLSTVSMCLAPSCIPRTINIRILLLSPPSCSSFTSSSPPFLFFWDNLNYVTQADLKLQAHPASAPAAGITGVYCHIQDCAITFNFLTSLGEFSFISPEQAWNNSTKAEQASSVTLIIIDLTH